MLAMFVAILTKRVGARAFRGNQTSLCCLFLRLWGGIRALKKLHYDSLPWYDPVGTWLSKTSDLSISKDRVSKDRI